MALSKSQQSLNTWTGADWGTKSGKPSTQGPKATGERYLPKAAIGALSNQEYAATTAAKRKTTEKGKQVSKQPKNVAKKTRAYTAMKNGGMKVHNYFAGGLAKNIMTNRSKSKLRKK
jgi:hypothetical protein